MSPATKIDLYKQYRQDYVAPRKPVLVNIGEATYLAITGQGAPGGETFTAAIGALYAVAFTVKMKRKFAGLQDYAVGKLEGQYWGAQGDCFTRQPKSAWCWRLLIRTPDFIADRDRAAAVAALLAKGKPAEVKQVALERFTEGSCVQMLHVGPYDREGETVAQMQAFAATKGLRFEGRHHEIYLSDPRRVPAAKLRTILRQPVR